MPDVDEALSPPTTEPAKGLDDLISSALDGYGEEPKAAPEAPTEETSSVKIDATGRAHGADGKFAPKSADTKPSETEPAKVEAKPAEATQPDPAIVQPIEAPPRWSEAEKAQFAGLPREAQQVLVERHKAMEADYTRKTQEVAETRKSVEPLIQEVGKWNGYLQQLGLTADQAFSQMLTTEYTLRTGTPEQKASALAYLSQLYGVTLPNPQGGDGIKPDPSITQLHQTVAGLQSQLRRYEEQRVQGERERAQAEFDALGQAKNPDGSLKFPHFGRVNSTMIQLVASGQADTWDAAYTKAVRLDDDLYKQSVETERQRVAAEADKARQEAVDKAHKAKPVKTSEGSPKGGAELKGLDAHLGAALERSGLGG